MNTEPKVYSEDEMQDALGKALDRSYATVGKALVFGLVVGIGLGAGAVLLWQL